MATAEEHLAPIRERLAAATPGPWKADTVVRGDCVVWGPNGRFLMNAQAEPHWLEYPGEKRYVAFDVDKRDVQFIANARTDTARLLAALDGVLALPHEDYCCTKGCPGFGLAMCGKVFRPGDACDGSECSCYMSGPIAAITQALEGQA